jgi:mannose-6-phosphate isomerase-like protein (cupin superfamily)
MMTHTSLIRANDGLTLKPGPVETLRFKMTHEDTDGAFDYLIGEIGYAGGPPLHIHVNEDEVLHLLEGELVLRVGDETVEMTAGDVAFVPKGVPHSYTNRNKMPARAVGVFVPSGLARFLTAFAALPPGASDQQQIEAIGREHGVVVVGPPLAVSLGLV